MEHANDEHLVPVPLKNRTWLPSSTRRRPGRTSSGPSEQRIVGQRRESVVQPADIRFLLPLAPTLMRVERDRDEITMRLHGEAISRPLLASRPRRRENAFLARILRPAAGDTL